MIQILYFVSGKNKEKHISKEMIAFWQMNVSFGKIIFKWVKWQNCRELNISWSIFKPNLNDIYFELNIIELFSHINISRGLVYKNAEK